MNEKRNKISHKDIDEHFVEYLQNDVENNSIRMLNDDCLIDPLLTHPVLPTADRIHLERDEYSISCKHCQTASIRLLKADATLFIYINCYYCYYCSYGLQTLEDNEQKFLIHDEDA